MPLGKHLPFSVRRSAILCDRCDNKRLQVAARLWQFLVERSCWARKPTELIVVSMAVEFRSIPTDHSQR